MTQDRIAYDDMAALLDASGDYRVLRRMRPRAALAIPQGTRTRLGLLVDTETTGLNPATDEIIELAMIPFAYGLDGTLYEVREGFHAYRQPSLAIPPEITAITGITDEMVAGQAIDPDAVAAFMEPVDLVIAHNAAFDRRILERFSPAFAAKPWACSSSEIDWKAEGFEAAKLGYLTLASGFFHDGHRATDDCLAAIELLARPLPRSGTTALAVLLARARAVTWRIWAEGTPFETKDTLKARGYRWNPGDDDQPKAWFIDVPEETREAELSYLRTEIYGSERNIRTVRMTAWDRFSDRV